MLPHVTQARYVTDYTIWVRFDDGVEGEVNLSSELQGPIFEPLNDLEVFRQFSVHPELRTLVWPNGADFAPAFLYSSVKIAA